MKNKFKKIKAYYFLLLILLIFSKIPVMNIEAEGNISDIFIKEYNMSVLSVDQNNQIMSIRHKEFNIRGVQFHPESILTPFGKKILSNWVNN